MEVGATPFSDCGLRPDENLVISEIWDLENSRPYGITLVLPMTSTAPPAKNPAQQVNPTTSKIFQHPPSILRLQITASHPLITLPATLLFTAGRCKGPIASADANPEDSYCNAGCRVANTLPVKPLEYSQRLCLSGCWGHSPTLLRQPVTPEVLIIRGLSRSSGVFHWENFREGWTKC